MKSIKLASYKEIIQDCTTFGSSSVILPESLPLSEFGKKAQDLILSIFKEVGGKYNTKTETFTFPKAKNIEEVEQILNILKSENKPDLPEFEFTPEIADIMVKSLLYNPVEKDQNVFIVVACAGDHDSAVISAILRAFPGTARIAYHSDENIDPEYAEHDFKPVPLPYLDFTKIYTPEMGVVSAQIMQPQNYIILAPEKIDLNKIYHAYNLLKHGGRLVTIVSDKVPSERYLAGFMSWLNDDTEYYKFVEIENTNHRILTIDK